MTFTVSQIAEVIGVDRRRLAWIVQREGIEPDGLAGVVRLFGPATATRIVEAAGVRRRPGRPRKTNERCDCEGKQNPTAEGPAGRCRREAGE